ncbi:MAG: NAD(P)-dependent oxidoreductase [Acidobacteriota bacterium]|nr:NAD(P)-dependent oxidoreductase [Acidobacteriota bacterium]
MKVFLAGATGAIGQRLLPLLIKDGHEVFASTRSSAKVEGLQHLGARPLVVDVLDETSIRRAVVSVGPDVVIHELTALSHIKSYRHLDDSLAETNLLRTRGLDNLIAAAVETGAGRFIAQSFGGWPNGRGGPRIKSEVDPLDDSPSPSMAKSLAAIKHIETTVPSIPTMTGIVLRYGQLYGPGTGFSTNGAMVRLVESRSFPLIGGGCGIWSFVHVDDAASATVAALTRGDAGIYNVVDNEPSEISNWLPFLAGLIRAKRPYSVPKWLGRILAGDAVTVQMTAIRGLSNQKARLGLDWHPQHATWRTGFREIWKSSN